MFTKILVPLDGSVMAEAALRPAAEFARCMGAELILATVHEDLPLRYYPTDAGVIQAALDDARADATHYVHAQAELLREREYNAHAVAIEGTNVAAAILDYSEKHGIDLIAMSTHGRSGLTRFLMGSVADRITHSAKVPVLLVRPDLS
ncbi:MAG: universal stress protein [Thermoflexales bacterium]|nr:universal stress protein [Thermoflexales bacterium]